MAARARNAARRGAWIALAGALAVSATISALIFIPRAADRELQQRLDAIPPAPDTLPVVHRLDSLQRLKLASATTSDSTRTDSTRPDSTRPDSVRADSSLKIEDLDRRIAQTRQAMLPESFRALALHPLVRGDVRVSVLLDSIDRVDREREAHAALGGPGARYAALTARLTALGQRLLAVAESHARPTTPTIAFPNTALGAMAQRIIDSVAAARADSARREQQRRDSLAVEQRIAIDHRFSLDSALLTALRLQHAQVATERARLETRRSAVLPAAGVVLASLIVGLAVGFSLVLLRELRRPTVGDLEEVRALAGTAVLVHGRSRSAGTSTSRDATRGAARALRERPGVPALIDRDSDTFTVLHLALSGVGDLVEQVDILADQPMHAAAVALSTAAVAASESRAVLVFASGTDSVLPRIVGAAKRASVSDTADLEDAALHELTIDRDTHVDVLLSPPPVNGSRDRLFDRYDLRVALPAANADASTLSRDVVLVARRGSTELAWLTDGVRRAHARKQRIRAVVLWSRPRPRA